MVIELSGNFECIMLYMLIGAKILYQTSCLCHIILLLVFQKQLKALESNLEKNLKEKLQSLEKGHQAACEKLEKR